MKQLLIFCGACLTLAAVRAAEPVSQPAARGTATETDAPELDSQFAALEHDLKQRATFEKYVAETYRPEALAMASDRDPADIVLRRTSALHADLKLGRFDAPLAELRQASANTPVTNAAARRALFNDACRLRRRIAFANPLLDFDQLLLIKRHRAIYDHMCDQFYGITARPGGGLYVLKNPFGPKPELRDVLANSVVDNGRLKGRRLFGGNGAAARLSWDGVRRLSGDETEGGAFLSPSLSFDGKQILFAYVECSGSREQQFHTDPARGHWDQGRSQGEAHRRQLRHLPAGRVRQQGTDLP